MSYRKWAKITPSFVSRSEIMIRYVNRKLTLLNHFKAQRKKLKAQRSKFNCSLQFNLVEL